MIRLQDFVHIEVNSHGWLCSFCKRILKAHFFEHECINDIFCIMNLVLADLFLSAVVKKSGAIRQIDRHYGGKLF